MNSKQKLLVVEDHQAIRQMLVSIFQNAGYEVVEASDGAIGLASAQQGGFTAILLDLKMPQMDGLEFMDHLKKMPPRIPNGPIIVFSSHGFDYAKKKAMEAGAAAFIEKDNIETIKLVDQVEQVINNYQPPPQTS